VIADWRNGAWNRQKKKKYLFAQFNRKLHNVVVIDKGFKEPSYT